MAHTYLRSRQKQRRHLACVDGTIILRNIRHMAPAYAAQAVKYVFCFRVQYTVTEIQNGCQFADFDLDQCQI